MVLNSGRKLGPYEIQSPLGAGGMGEVYRARDTRLERTVAIKILPAQLSSEPVRKQRFEREAKTISSLNHPHICVLHDVGHQDGIDYLVMECVEGETLAKRLEKGPLPLNQVLTYGAQIADALDASHRNGVVHRDLKPGNIMLTAAGVKLLDFGLAKLASPLASGAALTAEATQTTPVTEPCAILGTFPYMSPEQLEGKEADARSDIFALGVVLYEIATGKRAFEGKSQATVIAAILTQHPPPISQLQPMSPPALDLLVKACLAKDPNERWQTAHDVRLQLECIAEAAPTQASAASRTKTLNTRERIAWLAGALVLLAMLAASYLQRPATATDPTWSYIVAPERTTFSYFAGPVTVSPDGRRLAFVASTPEGKETIWVRALDSPNGQELPGTEGASYPFWSADSRFLGFFAGGKLRTIEASSGPVLTVCDAQGTRGGTWNRNGTILFSGTWTPVYRVSASGGVPVPITTPNAPALSHRWPYFLPDGRHFLYLEANFSAGSVESASVHVASLDSTENKLLLHARSNVAYFNGYLLFLRERTLMAQPFDVKELRTTADAFPIAGHVQFNDLVWGGVFSVSENGVLAYQGAATLANSQLLMFDRKGTQLKRFGEPADFNFHMISPDGQKLVASILDPSASNYQLWVWSRSSWTRLTFGAWRDAFPVWSPDGSRILFASNRKGSYDLYAKPSNGMGNEQLLLESTLSKFPTSWSPDGLYVACNINSLDKRRVEVWILPLFGDRKPFAFLQADSNIGDARFSPDGRWMAYAADESGRVNVYVTSFPDRKGKWQVSSEGGSMPRWRRDAKELFYLSSAGQIMAAEVSGSGPEFRVGTVHPLFHALLKTGPSHYDLTATSTQIGYDVSPDGQSFVVNSPASDTVPPITLVTNWRAGRPR